MSSPGFTFTFIVTIIISVFVPRRSRRSRVVQKLKKVDLFKEITFTFTFLNNVWFRGEQRTGSGDQGPKQRLVK